MWKNFGLVVFTGLSAGSLVGVIEALQLLLAVGAGEYDALLWGGVGYGLVGATLSVMFCSVSWRWTELQIYVRVFVAIGTLLSWWVFDLHPLSGIVFFMMYRLMGVLMEKTPLRVLLRPKGAFGITILWFVLLTTFSLTPSQRIYSPPIHQHSAAGKPNVLLLTVDGLRKRGWQVVIRQT